MKRRIRLAAASSLLSLAAFGLDACGGGDDKTVTSEPSPIATEAVGPLEKKSCGRYPPGSHRWALEVEGDISCAEGRRVFGGLLNDSPYFRFRGWSCSGPDGNIECTKGPEGTANLVIRATF
jgi:hypothetical protein